MRSPAAGDRDVNPTISAINPAGFRPVDLFGAVHRLWREATHVPGEESGKRPEGARSVIRRLPHIRTRRAGFRSVRRDLPEKVPVREAILV